MVIEFLSKNLQFLRLSLGVTVTELCDLIGIDCIDYYRIEQQGIVLGDKFAFFNDSPLVIELCNYYTITLDAMMCEDVSLPENYDPKTIELLKREQAGSARLNRKPFFEQIYNHDYVEADDSDKDAMKMLCYTAHKVERINSRYWALRKAGKIPRNDFFEGE